MFHRRTPVAIPEGADWSKRSSPAAAAFNEGLAPMSRIFFKRVHQIARENGQYMRDKKAAQNGLIIGYHGTTVPNALSIMDAGFRNTKNEEGTLGVSAWDEVVALEALRYANHRSKSAGEFDEGVVVKLQMSDPQHDSRYGRLEWLGDARTVTPLEVLTLAAMIARFGEPALHDIHLDLPSAS